MLYKIHVSELNILTVIDFRQIKGHIRAQKIQNYPYKRMTSFINGQYQWGRINDYRLQSLALEGMTGP